MAEGYTIQLSQKRLDLLTGQMGIDKDALDEEFVRQPNLYWEVAHEYSRAMGMKDQLRHEIDLTKAELDKTIRDRYERDGGRLTEAKLESEILNTQRMADILNEYDQWKYMTEVWNSLKEATSQRAYALRDLAQLHISGYYATSPIKEVSDDIKASRVREAIRQKLRE